MLTGIAILVVLLIMIALMYVKKISALLALPIMAILFAVIAQEPLDYILTEVLEKGPIRLSSAYIAVIFGGILATYVSDMKITDGIIRSVAELAGDRPFIVALSLMVVTALLFTTLGGLGAVIMTGSIIFPILLSLGTPPILAAGIMLIGISAGGTLNIAGWQLYIDFLGVTQQDIKSFALCIAPLYLITGVVVLILGMSNRKLMKAWAIDIRKFQKKPEEKLHPLAYLSPLIPLLAVLIFNIPIIPAFILGIIYTLVSTWRKGSINLMTGSFFKGAESVLPAVYLMIGIGMLLNSVTHPNVIESLSPFMEMIIPGNRLMFILVFTILAPLALYRGPLNIWGMGSGLAGILLATNTLSPKAIMAILMSVGCIQGVCDPTNTHNVWIANYLSVDVLTITKKLLPFIWVLVFFALIIAAFKYV
ncbi:MAG: hypothetical protein ABIJ12_07365 [bacterium]|nr:hypothetical protein [bacterium]